jgi:threonine dehydrogenase-like Zn-dependent dehydrogenase
MLFRHRRSPGLKLCGYPGHFLKSAEYALDKIISGELRLVKLITHYMEFEEYAEVVRLLKEQEAIKVCFRPNG